MNRKEHMTRTLLFEPSGTTEFEDPLLEPSDVVHLFGTGQMITRRGTACGVGSGCIFSSCVEAVLLQLGVPFVSHVLDWRQQKPDWFRRRFPDTYTPAVYFRGQYLQEPAAALITTILGAYPEQAEKRGLWGESRLPAAFRALDSMMAVFFYLNHSPCDEGSAEHKQLVAVAAERRRSLLPVELPFPPSAQAMMEEAQQVCISKLRPLEHVLDGDGDSDSKASTDGPLFCCGSRPGIADVTHFTILQTLLDILAPLWGMRDAVLAAMPHISAWMQRMRLEPCNTFSAQGGHDAIEYVSAFAPMWTSTQLKNRAIVVDSAVRARLAQLDVFRSSHIPPAVMDALMVPGKPPISANSARLVRTIVLEPSGLTEFDEPRLEPADCVHLFGLGAQLSCGGNPVALGAGCTFATCVEAVLRYLEVPYVQHAFMWDCPKPAWYQQKFSGQFTPALYFRGQFTQETEDIIRTVMEAHSSQCREKGLCIDEDHGIYASLLPEGYSVFTSLLAVYNFLNHGPFDEGSIAERKAAVSASEVAASDSTNQDEERTELPSTSFTAKERAEGVSTALEVCLQELAPLELVLSKNPFVCGSGLGTADIMHFQILQVLLDLFAPVWDLREPVLSQLPSIDGWMARLRFMPSNPFNGRDGHDPWQFIQGFSSLWLKKLENRSLVVDRALRAHLASSPLYAACSNQTGGGAAGAKGLREAAVNADVLPASQGESSLSTPYKDAGDAVSEVVLLKDKSGDTADTANVAGSSEDALQWKESPFKTKVRDVGMEAVVHNIGIRYDDECDDDISREATPSDDPAGYKFVGSSDKAAQKKAKASKRSALHSGSMRDPYWYMLDISMKRLLLLLFCSYVLLIVLGGCFALIFVDMHEHVVTHQLGSAFELAVMNSAVCIVTMAGGDFVPITATGHWVFSLLQLTGVIWNVLIFSVIVTRFQHPDHEIHFSKRATTQSRDGLPVLLFRIGNERGNYIFNPNVQIFVINAATTLEGETYMQTTEVPIRSSPPVIAGTFNIVAEIKSGSKLEMLCRGAGGEAVGDMDDTSDRNLGSSNYSLLVTMSGFDDTYQSEVRAYHKYGTDDIFVNHTLVDCVKADKRNRPYVCWDSFHASMKKSTSFEMRPLYTHKRALLKESKVFTPVLPSAIHLFGTVSGASPDCDDRDGKVFGGSMCTTALEFLLSEMHIPYVLYGVDIVADGYFPSWFTHEFPSCSKTGDDSVEDVLLSLSREFTVFAWFPGRDRDSSHFVSGIEDIISRVLLSFPVSSVSLRCTESRLPSNSFSPKENFENILQYLNYSPGANNLNEALLKLVLYLRPLETRLNLEMYCCGDSAGVDDFVRFCVFMFCFDILAPIASMKLQLHTAFFVPCPGIRRWMKRMGSRLSNPYHPLYASRETLTSSFESDSASKDYYGAPQFLLAHGGVWRAMLNHRSFDDTEVGYASGVLVARDRHTAGGASSSSVGGIRSTKVSDTNRKAGKRTLVQKRASLSNVCV